MLCKATELFIWLKALLASISNIPFVPSSAKTRLIACIAASEPALWPAHTCRLPAACLISSFKNPAMVFPTIRLRTSPTPIGRISGFLSRGMSLQEVRPSSNDGW